MKNKFIMTAFLISGLLTYGCGFAGWLFPAQPPCTETFSLRVATIPEGAGTCTVTPDIAFYEYGSQVTIAVSPNTHYEFSHWEGDADGTSTSVSMSMTGQKSLLAVFKIAPGYCGIAGTVMDSAGGAPVEGATIKLVGSAVPTVTTNPGGTFNLISNAIDTTGTYEVLVSKTGMASSKVQAVKINTNEITRVDIIQTNYSFDINATSPPTINIPVISSTNIAVTVTAGSSPLQSSGEHESIYLKIGSVSNQYYDATSQTNTLSYNWDPTNYPPGNLNVKFVAYDTNNNRSELNVPYTVSTHSGYNTNVPSLKPGPCNYFINAYSFGRSLMMYSIQPSAAVNSTRLLPDKTTLSGKNPSPLYGLSTNGAPAGCTAYVHVFLLKLDSYINAPVNFSTEGLAVYHAPAQAGSYTLAGKTNKFYFDEQMEANLFQFRDYSPLISPGKTLWYKVAWINGYGEGPQSDPIEVPILPVYSLSLFSPSNNMVITDNTPLLQWDYTPVENATRFDELVVLDALGGELVLDQVYQDINQVECPSLNYGKLYKWNILSCYQLIKGQCVSKSLPSDSYYANNGYFYFSINPTNP